MQYNTSCDVLITVNITCVSLSKVSTGIFWNQKYNSRHCNSVLIHWGAERGGLFICCLEGMLSVLMFYLQHCILFFLCWGWGFLQVHHRAGISATCHTGGHRKRGEEHYVANEESRDHEDLVAAKTQLKCKKKANISHYTSFYKYIRFWFIGLLIRISSETPLFKFSTVLHCLD